MVYTWRLYTENATEFWLKHMGYMFQLVNFLFLWQVGRLVVRRLTGRAGDKKK